MAKKLQIVSSHSANLASFKEQHNNTRVQGQFGLILKEPELAQVVLAKVVDVWVPRLSLAPLGAMITRMIGYELPILSD